IIATNDSEFLDRFVGVSLIDFLLDIGEEEVEHDAEGDAGEVVAEGEGEVYSAGDGGDVAGVGVPGS
ncbi:MAG: hypothetical protein Q9215_005547, partial [Flavoplaca cf. flavocitrina]